MQPVIKEIKFDLGDVMYFSEPFKARVAVQWAKSSKLPVGELEDIFHYGRNHPRKDEFWAVIAEFDMGNLLPHEVHLKINKILESEMSFDDFVASWELMIEPDYDFIAMVEEIQGPYLGIISNLCVLHHRKVARTLPRKKFRSRIYSYVERCMKPEEDIYLLAINDSGLPPENLLFVDNMIPNIETASRLGMNVYHYDIYNSRSSEECLRQLRDYLRSFGFIQ